jgi:short-subunit dehydrogenase
VINPGLTQTNFSANLIEKKAKVSLDHMRGMTPETVAVKSFNAIERGTYEITLTGQGKALVMLNRLFPRLVDRIAKRRVRKIFHDELPK